MHHHSNTILSAVAGGLSAIIGKGLLNHIENGFEALFLGAAGAFGGWVCKIIISTIQKRVKNNQNKVK